MKTSSYVIKKGRGQAAMEMGILVSIVVIALIAMQTYLKRAIQGNLRSNVDSIGAQYDYERTMSNYVSRQDSNVTTFSDTEEQTLNGQRRSVSTTNSITHYDDSSKRGYEYVGRP